MPKSYHGSYGSAPYKPSDYSQKPYEPTYLTTAYKAKEYQSYKEPSYSKYPPPPVYSP